MILRPPGAVGLRGLPARIPRGPVARGGLAERQLGPVAQQAQGRQPERLERRVRARLPEQAEPPVRARQQEQEQVRESLAWERPPARWPERWPTGIRS